MRNPLNRGSRCRLGYRCRASFRIPCGAVLRIGDRRRAIPGERRLVPCQSQKVELAGIFRWRASGSWGGTRAHRRLTGECHQGRSTLTSTRSAWKRVGGASEGLQRRLRLDLVPEGRLGPSFSRPFVGVRRLGGCPNMRRDRGTHGKPTGSLGEVRPSPSAPVRRHRAPRAGSGRSAPLSTWIVVLFDASNP